MSKLPVGYSQGRFAMSRNFLMSLPGLMARCTFGIVFGASVLILSTFDSASSADRERKTKTATPIKHLIVVIGENRGFDHLFGVYKPRPGQRIANLLFRGIVNE